MPHSLAVFLGKPGVIVVNLKPPLHDGVRSDLSAAIVDYDSATPAASYATNSE
jgi:hypothetical protein